MALTETAIRDEVPLVSLRYFLTIAPQSLPFSTTKQSLHTRSMALLISNRCDVQESQNTFLQIYSSRLKPEWEYTTMMLPSQRSERHVAAQAILDAFVFYPVHT